LTLMVNIVECVRGPEAPVTVNGNVCEVKDALPHPLIPAVIAAAARAKIISLFKMENRRRLPANGKSKSPNAIGSGSLISGPRRASAVNCPGSVT
jgi:hypothetical protein